MSPGTVIVGASVGGVRTAQALRAAGYEGTITLVDAEPRMPYDKPPLSKGFLSGVLGPDRLSLISEVELKQSKIELIAGVSAQSLDIARSEIILQNSSRIGFEYLVVATGVRARPSPWSVSSGLHLLRTLDDAEKLQADMRVARSIVIVGAGFIGAEVAATARHYGLEVSIIDPLSIPMARVLGDAVGERFIGLHHQNGVKTFFGTGVESITGSLGALEIELVDAKVLKSDLVVVGIGAVPNDEWLRSSGILVENGVVCDEFCKAQGASDIFAVGDVARWLHLGHERAVRVEHWTNAVEQANCVAHNIVNPANQVAYTPVEYVWSDQYDWKVQIAGVTAEAAGQVVIDDPENPKRFAALYFDASDKYCGVATVNWPRALIEGRRGLLAAEKDLQAVHAKLSGLLSSTRK